MGPQDVALAGADLDRARQRERAFATSGQQSVRGLEVVVGRYPSAELALAPDLPRVPAPVPEGLPSELLERRPDLVAAERRVASAFHLIQAAEAARLPRIALTAFGGRSTSELLRLAGVGAGFWRLGVDLLAPIFTGGALEAQVHSRRPTSRPPWPCMARPRCARSARLKARSRTSSSWPTSSVSSSRCWRRIPRHCDSTACASTSARRICCTCSSFRRGSSTRSSSLIGVRNDRLANRVALHLALGGGFTPVPTP